MPPDPADEAIALHIRRINLDPDELHMDMTPSVLVLGESGLAAVDQLLDLLAGGDEMTRMRAQRALEAILARRHGFRAGRGFSCAADEDAMRAEWRANGDYEYAGDAHQRAASVAKWRLWLATAKE